MGSNRKHIKLLSTDDDSLIAKIHFDSDKIDGELFKECLVLVKKWCYTCVKGR